MLLEEPEVVEVIGNIYLYCELVFDVVAGLLESDRVPEFRKDFDTPLEAQYACLDELEALAESDSK